MHPETTDERWIIEEKVAMPIVLLLAILPLTEKRCSYFSLGRTHAAVTSTMELGQFHILQDDISAVLATPTMLKVTRSHGGIAENWTLPYLARVIAR